MGVDVVELDSLLTGNWKSPLSAEHEDVLDIAVRSALITFFRTDRPKTSRKSVRRMGENFTHEARGVYRGLRSLFARHDDLGLAYIPNGRFPHQRMAHLAARDSGVEVLHFEKGETPHRSYLQPHAPQSREATQLAVEPVLRGMTPDDVERTAQEWLSRRGPTSDSNNQFSALWGADLPKPFAVLSAGQRVAGFFTSSQDEFAFAGPEWELHDWTDQYEAFHLIMQRMEKAGYRCYLRVHPNLATKAQDLYSRERAGVKWLAKRHPNLIVIWHDDIVNTYSLLDVTHSVVVWGSTVGLEASARGIPVWTTATTRYGLTADVREVLSQEQLDEQGLEPWDVDAHAARRYIAYLVARDEPMDPSYKSWLPWDRDNQPVAARIAAVLASGGIPNPLEAFKSQVDVYRHRRLKSNLRNLRRN